LKTREAVKEYNTFLADWRKKRARKHSEDKERRKSSADNQVPTKTAPKVATKVGAKVVATKDTGKNIVNKKVAAVVEKNPKVQQATKSKETPKV